MAAFDRLRRTALCDVLVVCTGNVCRSPYVAAVLGAQLPGLTVGSAGTAARAGAPSTEQIVALLDAHGLSLDQHAARPLTRPMVRGAQLILTATRTHRGSVLRLDRRADERTFTLKEFARLLPASDPAVRGNLTALLARANAARVSDSVAEHDDDLLDPYGLDDLAYRAMADDADAATGTIVAAWCGEPNE